MGSSHTYYDETLTQSLWNKFINDNTSHVYYSWRLGSYGTLQVTGSHGSSSQFDGEDVYYNYKRCGLLQRALDVEWGLARFCQLIELKC